MSDDVQTHPDEVSIDTVTVDGVAVAVFHHASFNREEERGYRLRRLDTGDEQMAWHTKDVKAIKPALARQALAETFVRQGVT